MPLPSLPPHETPTGGSGSDMAGEREAGGYAMVVAVFLPCLPDGATQG
jgi:hypothetical protein